MKKTKQESTWKDRLFKFEKSELETRIYMGLIALFLGGVFIGMPLGAIAQLTQERPSTHVFVNLYHATLGGALAVAGVLVFIGGLMYVHDQMKMYRQLKRA